MEKLYKVYTIPFVNAFDDKGYFFFAKKLTY
jgi:hypothetical protein